MQLILALLLGALLLATGFALRRLGRLLGGRLPTWLILGSAGAAMLLLTPWLLRSQLLVSTDFLTQSLVPDVEQMPEAGRYGLLNDNAMQFLPWEMELRRLWASGSLGFWSDRLEGGSSLWSNPQAAVLSPIAWCARLFPIEWFFLVRIAVGFVVCVLGTALLTRRLGAGWRLSGLAGLAAAMSGAMVPWALFTHSDAAAWAPWAVAGFLAVARRPKSRSICGAALATACLLLSGHPEVAFAAGCLAVLVAAWFRSTRWPLVRQCGAVLVAAALGLSLSAPVVLPFLEAVTQSQRADEVNHYQEELAAEGLSFHPGTWIRPEARRLPLTVLHPNVFGRPYLDSFRGVFNWVDSGSGYAGVWAFAGALLALCLTRRALPLLLFATFALLASAEFVPLLALVRLLPGFSAMALTRFLLVSSIALCVAGALGFHQVRRRVPSLLALLVLSAGAGLSALAAGPDQLLLSLLLWGGVGVALWTGEPAGGRVRAVNGFVMALLVTILAGQLGWTWRMLPKSDPRSFYPESPVFGDLAAASVGEDGAARVLGFDFQGYPSLLSVYGFDQTRTHNPMAPVGQLQVLRAGFGFAPDEANYFAPITRVDAHWLDRLSIGALLAPDHSFGGIDREPPAGLELFAHHPPLAVFRNPDPWPRWFLAPRVRQVSQEDVETSLRSLRSEVLVVEAPPAWAQIQQGTAAGSDASLRLLSQRPGSIELRVEDSGSWTGGLLATSLPAPSGWEVRAFDAQGQPARVRSSAVDGAFAGAWVGPETVRLSLSYRPPWLRTGIALFLLAAAAIGWSLRR